MPYSAPMPSHMTTVQLRAALTGASIPFSFRESHADLVRKLEPMQIAPDLRFGFQRVAVSRRNTSHTLKTCWHLHSETHWAF